MKLYGTVWARPANTDADVRRVYVPVHGKIREA